MEVKDYMLSIYKDLYLHEFDVQARLENSAGIPMAMLSAVFVMNIYVLEKIPLPLTGVGWFFLAWIAVVFFTCIVPGVYCLVRYRLGYFYKRVPHLDELHGHYKGLVKYYSDTDEEKSEEIAGQEVLRDLVDKYAAAAGNNSRNNVQKSGCLYNASKFFVFAVLLTFGCAATETVSRMFGLETLLEWMN